MSLSILIMGESGNGKTTSIKNLPPEQTFYINCDGKNLPWKGWKTQYNTEKGNYLRTTKVEIIQDAMKKVYKMKNIKYLVIDTLNSVMVADEMERMKDKGFDKWQDLAQSVYYIVRGANMLRDDQVVIMMAHTQTDMNDNGYMWTHIKTNGKKLNKICLESFLPTVLWAKCKDGQYVFETQANNSTAKTPLGAFNGDIDNDIMKVVEVLKEY